jgi:hypothetical protein
MTSSTDKSYRKIKYYNTAEGNWKRMLSKHGSERTL